MRGTRLRSSRFVVIAAIAFFTASGFASRAASTARPEPRNSIVDARALILAPQSGDTRADVEITRLQGKIRVARDPAPLISRLGWAFVAKARISSDPGYYKLAEQCSLLVEGDSDALLLRGYVFHALHRFAEAEAVARDLTSDPIPRWQAYALLGDGLMEQGKLEPAKEAYQQMIDIRPCLQTYARVAHYRWLKGDLSGAEELMRMAVESGNSRDPEPASWAYSQLAFYQLAANDLDSARLSLDRALEFVVDYPAALFLRSKLELADSNPAKAAQTLRVAIAQTPLPEYQWALADSARLAGNKDLSEQTEKTLRERGAGEDPRSFALYLATRNQDVASAVKLAQEELSTRRDIFTYDAVAWAALAAGKTQEAYLNIQLAVNECTVDARLLYHAGVITAAVGDRKKATEWLQRALVLQYLLQPSERADLLQQLSALSSSQPLLSQTTRQTPAAEGRN